MTALVLTIVINTCCLGFGYWYGRRVEREKKYQQMRDGKHGDVLMHVGLPNMLGWEIVQTHVVIRNKTGDTKTLDWTAE